MTARKLRPTCDRENESSSRRTSELHGPLFLKDEARSAACFNTASMRYEASSAPIRQLLLARYTHVTGDFQKQSASAEKCSPFAAPNRIFFDASATFTSSQPSKTAASFTDQKPGITAAAARRSGNKAIFEASALPGAIEATEADMILPGHGSLLHQHLPNLLIPRKSPRRRQVQAPRVYVAKSNDPAGENSGYARADHFAHHQKKNVQHRVHRLGRRNRQTTCPPDVAPPFIAPRAPRTGGPRSSRDPEARLRVILDNLLERTRVLSTTPPFSRAPENSSPPASPNP